MSPRLHPARSAWSRAWALPLLALLVLILGACPAQETGEEAAGTAAEETAEEATEEAAPPATEAKVSYFEIGFPTLAEGRFVIALSDPAKIEQARKAITDPENNPHSVLGIIAKKPAPYNKPWSYHLEPPTIEFFENAVEVCDAAPQYVEEHLEEACGAFLPDCRWCPWTSQILKEIAVEEDAEPEADDSGEGDAGDGEGETG